jgi:cystathionine beta-lyase/cystathionine gamma-synthase
MTHGSLSPQERLASGIAGDLLRLSVGIEDTDDLIADLARVLDATQDRHLCLAHNSTA